MAVLTFSTIHDQSSLSFKWILIGLYIYLYCSKCMVHSESSDVPCDTNIYLEVGKPGTVHCNFEGFELLGWINGDGYPDPTTPFIYFENSQEKGRGYEDGDYNMLPDGSLIINNVQLKHEFNFTVLYVLPAGAPIRFTVLLRVFVKPFPAYPVVNEVTNQQFLVQEIDSSTGVLTCGMNGVWPAVGLEWVYPPELISIESETTVTGNEDSTSNTLLNSTFTVHGPLSGSITVECVVAGELSNVLPSKTTIYLLVQRDFPIVNGHSSRHHVVLHLNREDEVNCTVNGVSEDVSLEWVITTPDISDKILLEDKHSETTNEDGTLNLQLNTHLSILSQSVQHVTMECRASGDNADQYKEVTTVEVLVVKNFPVVNGLVGLHHVVLEVTQEAELSCSMNGVSQGISLEWVVITPYVTNEIHLEDTRSRTSNEDGTADVMLNSSLSVTCDSIDRVTLRCQVTGESADDFQEVTTVELLITPSSNFPIVNGRSSRHHVVLHLNREDELNCTVNGVSEDVSLEWVIITPDKSDEILLKDKHSKTTNEDGTFNLQLNTHLSILSQSVQHLTMECRVSGDDADQYKEVTTVEVLVVQNFPIVNGRSSGQHLVLHLNREDEVNCTVNGVSEDVSLVWVLITPDISDKILLEDKHSKTTNEDGTFNLQLNTHLSILSQSVQHLTMECRVSGDNAEWYKAVTTVEVLVVQNFPIVNGHSSHQYVVLHLNREDELTCLVDGVSEGVSLEWVIITPGVSGQIQLKDEHSKAINEDGTFTVTLTTHFSILSNAVQHVTMECRVIGQRADQYKEGTTVELLVSESAVSVCDFTRWRWIFAFVIIIAMLNAIMIFHVLFKKFPVKIAKKHMAHDPENQGEIPMKAANHRGSHLSLLELETQTTAADVKEMYTTIISLLNDMKHSADAGSSSHSSDSALS